MVAIDRRQLLAAIPSCAVAMMASRGALADARVGEPQRFDFDLLRQRAKLLAAKPHVPPPTPPRIVDRIDFDTVQKLKFRRVARCGRTGWAVSRSDVSRRKYNPVPVRLHLVSGDIAREVIYSARDFAYDRVALAGELPADLGYSGFRAMHVHTATSWDKDSRPLGRNYFRARGERLESVRHFGARAGDRHRLGRRGVSALRGFWLARPPTTRYATLVFYALLDSPSRPARIGLRAQEPRRDRR